MNLVLIGMPGAGKTTYGRKLAADRGWDFVDTDELVEKKTGKNVPELVRTIGWVGFRLLEKVSAIYAASLTNTVIATGGGVVEDEEVMALLRKSGFVIHLDVPLNTLLSRKHAVLTQSDITRAFYAREALYERARDVVLTNF